MANSNTIQINDPHAIGRMISAIENFPDQNRDWLDQISERTGSKKPYRYSVLQVPVEQENPVS
jgi:hypothetical protein